MTTFDAIAIDLLRVHGYEVDKFESGEEAIEKSKQWREGQPYPVYFSHSDTSGEKSFEEFYTKSEAVDMTTYASLGVIVDKQVSSKSAIVDLITEFDRAFQSEKIEKADIIKIIRSYLPNFGHIETGKSLDEKM